MDNGTSETVDMHPEDDALEGSMVVDDLSNVNLLPLSFGMSKQIQGTHFIDVISTMEHKHSPNQWQSFDQILCGCHWFPPDIISNSSESHNKILLMLSNHAMILVFC